MNYMLVFPVYAGVIPRHLPDLLRPYSVPRVCGGDPQEGDD